MTLQEWLNSLLPLNSGQNWSSIATGCPPGFISPESIERLGELLEEAGASGIFRARVAGLAPVDAARPRAAIRVDRVVACAYSCNIVVAGPQKKRK